MKLNIPPASKSSVISNLQLVDILKPLVGTEFKLSYKPRTDGSKIRKLISSHIENYATNALPHEYKVVPPRNKGVPKILAELIDTYVITSGEDYNLQVWNRNPNGRNALIKYANGDKITPKDIRLVMVKISIQKGIISSITILTPQYIEKKFGKFGKPTIKHQLLVSNKDRQDIISAPTQILLSEDTSAVKKCTTQSPDLSQEDFTQIPWMRAEHDHPKIPA